MRKIVFGKTKSRGIRWWNDKKHDNIDRIVNEIVLHSIK